MSEFSRLPVKVVVSGARGASAGDIARRVGAFGTLPTDTDSQFLDKFAQYAITQNPGFQSNISGPSNNTRLTLANLKAAATSDRTSLYDGSLWAWTLGDFTGRADDAIIVKANSTALTDGAWVRQNLTAGIPAEAFGISPLNSAAVNTPLFHKMWDFAAGRLTRIGNARYKYEGSYAGVVNMQGDRMPSVNTGRTALENGSVLEGYTNFSGTTVILRDLGVDHGSGAFATGGDAVKISASPYNSGRLALLHNVVGLGRNDNDGFHGILVEGFAKAVLNNVVGSTNQYCFAIKSRNVLFNGLHAIGGQNAIILKSDGSSAGSGSLASVAGSNVLIEGTANTVYGIRILAANQSISNVAISGVDMSSVGYGVVVETAAGVAISELLISNVNARDVRNFGVQTGGAGALYEAQFSNFNMVDLGDYAAQFQVGNIKLNNFYGSLKAGSTAHAATMVRAEATLSAFSASNVELVENYGAGAAKPALYLALNPLLSRLSGEMRYAVEGSAPEPGLNAQTPSGSTATLNLLPDLRSGRSTCVVSLGGPTTVTAINQAMPGTTTNYPRGYIVTIMNTSGSALTLKNNGNIRTRADADLVVGLNQTASFVWLGSSWHQVN